MVIYSSLGKRVAQLVIPARAPIDGLPPRKLLQGDLVTRWTKKEGGGKGGESSRDTANGDEFSDAARRWLGRGGRGTRRRSESE